MAKKEYFNSEKVIVEPCRLIFPNIFQKEVYQGQETKFKATLMIDRENPIMKEIREQIKEVLGRSGVKVKPENYCVRDGANFERDWYQDFFILTAGSHQRPVIINIDGSQGVEEEDEFYPGAIVRARVSFWINTVGTNRVVGNLHGLRKIGQGKRIGGDNPEETVDALGGDVKVTMMAGDGPADYYDADEEQTSETDPEDIPF